MSAASNLATRAAIASVSSAVLLLALKGYAAAETGSVAMLGSLADSALDLVASMMTLAGVRIAAQPADENHRFGHGKAEALVALFQVAVIAISAVTIFARAVSALSGTEQASNAEYGIAASVIAMLATGALVAYQRHVIAKTKSVAIGADKVHYESDVLLNGSVIVALVLDQYVGLKGADPVFGILIALWLAYGAWRASSEAIGQLMDREWPEEKRRRFIQVASRHPELRNLHDLRTRTSGGHDFAQFHMWMDPNKTVAQAHDIVEALEAALEAEFPGVEVLIHVDPEGHVDHPGNDLIEADQIALMKDLS